MMEEQILELTRQVTILNERLPNHITWSEKTTKDHETRLRDLEQSVPRDVRTQLTSLNQFRWILLGIAMASGGVGAIFAKAIGA